MCQLCYHCVLMRAGISPIILLRCWCISTIKTTNCNHDNPNQMTIVVGDLYLYNRSNTHWLVIFTCKTEITLIDLLNHWLEFELALVYLYKCEIIDVVHLSYNKKKFFPLEFILHFVICSVLDCIYFVNYSKLINFFLSLLKKVKRLIHWSLYRWIAKT